MAPTRPTNTLLSSLAGPALTAAMIAHGCGEASGGAEGPITIEALPAEFAAAACAKMFECCTDTEIKMQFELFTPPPETEEVCQGLYAGLLGLATSSWQASIEAQRLTYHDDLAGDCVAAIRQLSCAEYAAESLDTPASATACEGYLEPRVAEGGACSEDNECATQHCERDGEGDGVCTPLPIEGESCTFDCAKGLYCDLASSTCLPTKADDAECSSDEECQSDECLGADLSTGTTGICTTPNSCNGK